jgi:hypothetical protein
MIAYGCSRTLCIASTALAGCNTCGMQLEYATNITASSLYCNRQQHQQFIIPREVVAAADGLLVLRQVRLSA